MVGGTTTALSSPAVRQAYYAPVRSDLVGAGQAYRLQQRVCCVRLCMSCMIRTSVTEPERVCRGCISQEQQEH